VDIEEVNGKNKGLKKVYDKGEYNEMDKKISIKIIY
jgi:hypothetical protein